MERECKNLAEVGRRQFLKGSVAVAGAATATVSTQTAAAPRAPGVEYPVVRLANLADLVVDQPLRIRYPDRRSPGALIKLGVPAEGGVGPDGDVVAFSTMCPHQGIPLNYVAADKTLNCFSHYSRFDCEKAGFQIWGHATQNLTQFRLRVDDAGEIFAEGMDDLIFGRLSNVLDV